MRVITGKARGRRLMTLEGNDVRPTTDKVKEAIFSSIQFQISGSVVLDLFSGSGQLGIEALSRGANTVIFVDKSKKAFSVTTSNVESVGFSKDAKIVLMDGINYLKSTNEKYDIVFLDPPYRQNLIISALELLSDKMNEGGKIICEHESELVLPDKLKKLEINKVYKYGKINITSYVKEENK